MSISWEGFGAVWEIKAASSASTGKVSMLSGQASQHHEHRLGMFRRHLERQASIMSISWEGFGALWGGKPAGRLRRRLEKQGSIISISWEGFGAVWGGKPAS